MTTHRLSAAELLALWDRGLGRTLEERAVAMLAAVTPSAAPTELATLSVGERDRRLLELRSALFGDRCDIFATCPQCVTRLELSLSTNALLTSMAGASISDKGEVVAGDVSMYLRLPDSNDIAAARLASTFEASKRIIFERCVVEARRAGKRLESTDLSDALLPVFEAWLDECAAGEDLSLQLECAECGHDWALLFDAPSFLWSELDREARLLLDEVGALARAFGWSEADILAMSAVRRAAYVGVAL